MGVCGDAVRFGHCESSGGDHCQPPNVAHPATRVSGISELTGNGLPLR